MKYDPQITTILYATDMGDETRPVFRFAIDMAKHYNAEIIMLHVVEPMSDMARAIISNYLDQSVSRELEKKGMKSVLEKMRGRLEKFYSEECDSDEKSTVTIKEVMVVSGRPSEEILRIAEDEKAGMIVMGKSARKVRGIGVMGSSARRVSRLSKIPVLVIPTS
ncbi:MAG: universal stress protein [Deltaproteobacteria bacterium]|nr:universal stress protein [Deltaproteobacteria bacterium]